MVWRKVQVDRPRRAVSGGQSVRSDTDKDVGVDGDGPDDDAGEAGEAEPPAIIAANPPIPPILFPFPFP